MQEAILIAESPNPAFDSLMLDADGKVCCYSDCPPYGRLLTFMEGDLIDASLEFGERDAQGMTPARVQKTINEKEIQRTIASWIELSACWHLVWPSICKAIEETRKEYDHEAAPCIDSPTLSITAPGEYRDSSHEHWCLGFEYPAFDGCYCVDFNLDGEIIDRGVAF